MSRLNTSQAKPLSLYQGTVLPEWIDYNGHMNVAYYVLAFDHATDELFDYIGMDESYRAEQNCSMFTLELHVNYLQELKLGDPLRCATQIIDYDPKKIHYFHHMYHAEENYLAATNELMVLHMNMEQRRSTAMPASMLEKLEAIMQEHRQLPQPDQLGSTIGIRRK